MVFNNAPTTDLGFWHIFALSAAALLTAHLVFTLLLTYYKIQRQRRRHRELLALLASPSSDGPGTLVLNVDSPVAYCLPGGARSVTVLSDGLMAALEPDELRAVLIHENAHLSQRHHLLLLGLRRVAPGTAVAPHHPAGAGVGQLPDRNACRRRRAQDGEQGHADQGDCHCGQRLPGRLRRHAWRSASPACPTSTPASPAPPEALARPARRRPASAACSRPSRR